MPEPDAAIRAKLTAIRKNTRCAERWACGGLGPRLAMALADTEALASAVDRVLDLAAALHPGDGEDLADFDRASRVVVNCVRQEIAKALQVEVAGG